LSDATQKPLENWRQGDLILAPFRLPVLAAKENGDLAIKNLPANLGVAILSQSCDVVKSIADCAYVQIAPLTTATDKEAEEIGKDRKPRKVLVPALDGLNLAIDLDHVTTIEKILIANLPRTEGCPSDESQLRFGQALARHRGRFAFPDGFNAAIASIVKDWFKRRYKKNSELGELGSVDKLIGLEASGGDMYEAEVAC
jgi:hypothetical protein